MARKWNLSKGKRNPTVSLSVHPLERPVAALRNIENEIYAKANKRVIDFTTEDLNEDEDVNFVGMDGGFSVTFGLGGNARDAPRQYNL